MQVFIIILEREMAPHTCECRICGFQWKRSDDEFSGVTDTRATDVAELNKTRGAKTDKTVETKINSSEKAYDIPLRKVTVVGKNEEAVIGEEQKLTHSIGSKNENTVRNTVNKKSIDTGNVMAKSKVAERVENPVKISETNVKDNLTKNTDKQESKRSAVKEVTAMLNDTLVIPERKITPKQEVTINFEQDDMEKSTTTYPTVEQGFYSYADNTERKTYDEKENIDMKQKRKIEVHSRVTNRKYHTGRSPIPHNMPGDNYILLLTTLILIKTSVVSSLSFNNFISQLVQSRFYRKTIL